VRLCANCLCTGDASTVKPVPVGPEKGSQRDPYRDSLDLCEPCSTALLSGNLGVFAGRYSHERTVSRG
jgi:hypothetical protein